MKKRKPTIAEQFNRVLVNSKEEDYLLNLYIAGTTARSIRAIATLKALCEEHLPGRYILEVIDIYQHPGLAKGEQIIAVPTLIKKLPLPLRRFIGELTDIERILVGFNIVPKKRA